MCQAIFDDSRCTWREEGPVSQPRHVQIDAKVRTSFDPLLINTFFMGFWSGAEAEYLCQAQTGEYSHLKVLFLICSNAISKQIVNWIVFVETFLLLWVRCFPPRCCERFQWQCLDQGCNNESRPVWQLQGQWPTSAWVLQNLRFHSFEVEWNARN